MRIVLRQFRVVLVVVDAPRSMQSPAASALAAFRGRVLATVYLAQTQTAFVGGHCQFLTRAPSFHRFARCNRSTFCSPKAASMDGAPPFVRNIPLASQKEIRLKKNKIA